MRTLPLRLTPLPGEAFDAWLDAYAARLRISVTDLELAIVGRRGVLPVKPADVAARGLGVTDLELVASTTGIEVTRLAQTWRPLAAYQALVSKRLDGTLRQAFEPLSASRFCPQCLEATQGRWMSIWRIPCQVACPEHRCYLLDRCPACSTWPRHHTRPGKPRVDAAWTCTAILHDTAGLRSVCGADLRTAPTTTAETEALDAQSELANLTSGDNELAQRAGDRLVDLAAIMVSRPNTPLVPRLDSFWHPEETGALLVEASYVLDDSAAFAAHALADIRQRPPALPAHIRQTTPGMVSRMVQLRDPHMQPTERLRWRSLTTARRPNLDRASIRQRQDATPSALWVDWTIRLCPPTGLNADIFRTVTGAALLVPGATASTGVLFADHPARNLTRTFSHVLQNLPSAPGDTAILRVITQLAEKIDHHGSPIDYARRRRLTATADLITTVQWDTICEQAGVRSGGQTKFTNARRWIWETLTGGLLTDAPGDLKLTGQTTEAFHRFVLQIPSLAATALDDHAARLLQTHGIDEPLVWSPPLSWADLSGTPGVAPDSIDSETVHRMLRAGVPIVQIAEQLGTTVTHLRWIVRRQPPQLRPRSQANKVLRGRRPAHITPALLNQLVNIDGRSLRELSRELGMHRRRLAEILLEGPHDLPTPGRPTRCKPEPEWLREQYVDRGRTLANIATELNTTKTTVARVAKNYNIPLRPAGTSSHASAVTLRPELPELLASALAGLRGMQRVQRFQTIASSTSISAAGKTLGVRPYILSNQLNRLERSAGGALLLRQGWGSPVKVTPLGQQLLEQANAHAGKLAPAIHWPTEPNPQRNDHLH